MLHGGMRLSRTGTKRLEILARLPDSCDHPIPLLFIHGAYAAAWCWEEHFLPFFAEHGFASFAVSLSGHGGSPGREHLDAFSIADYVHDLDRAIEMLPGAPVLIGHSMGGMVAQKYLERAEVPGVVLMCSVPPQGLWGAALGLAFSRPGLMSELNRILGGGQVALDSLRQAMFAQPVEEEKLRRYYKRMQPESHRAIWDMTLFDLPAVHRVKRVPMLVLGAEHDALIPSSQVLLTARAYGTQAEILPGLGHGMMLERDWQLAAETILAWLLQLPTPSA